MNTENRKGRPLRAARRMTSPTWTLTPQSQRRSLALCVAVGLLAGMGCAKDPIAIPLPVTSTPYLVSAPDELLVTVLPEPSIEREVKVRPDGRISVDLIGDVLVHERTPTEIAEDIRAKISRYKRDATVTVFVQEALSNTITILGEVNRPQTVPVQRDLRVAEAIGMAGGTTPLNNPWGVRVIRTDDRGAATTHVINLWAITHGDTATNMLVQAGDVIVVPPNFLARIGYVFQSILFPFQPMMGGVAAAAAIAAF